MIVADLIKWLEQQPPANSVLLNIGDGKSALLDKRYLWTDAARLPDQEDARRFTKLKHMAEVVDST